MHEFESKSIYLPILSPQANRCDHDGNEMIFIAGLTMVTKRFLKVTKRHSCESYKIEPLHVNRHNHQGKQIWSSKVSADLFYERAKCLCVHLTLFMSCKILLIFFLRKLCAVA
jgi:hypothetical protein